MSGFQQYLTDAEIAEAAARLNIASLPKHRSNITRIALREGWRKSSLARRRAGREGGGGYEYHYTLLPLALQEALKAEYLRRGAAGAAALPAVREEAKAQLPAAVLATADLTARQREVMEARLVIVNTIEREALYRRLSMSVMTKQFLADLAAGDVTDQLCRMAAKANDKSRKDTAPLSARTVLRWISRARDGGTAALAPAKRDKQSAPQWLRAFFRYYGRPTKPSVAQAHANWLADNAGAQMPSIGQVRNALAKLPMIERCRGRLGQKELKAMKSYVSRDVSTMLPAEMYQADGKTFNAEVAHPAHGRPFRPEITTIIDAKTRRVVGWSAALDESANAVADALLMAVSQAGIPAIFYSDNGAGYRNAAMEDSLTGLLERLSITPMHALPYNSQAKGVVERFNRHWTELAREFPTYMGRDMDREAAGKAHSQTRREIKETGISALLPSWQQFLDACAAMVARYNAKPHRGLERITGADGEKRHLSPDDAWALAESQGFTADIVGAAELAELRMIWEVRRTRRGVVELFDNQYFAQALERLHGQEVIVAYSPTDGDRVICREITLIDGERKPGALIGTAKFAGHKTRMVPMTASEKAAEKRHKGRRARVGKKADEIDAELRQMVVDAHTLRPVPQIERPALQLEKRAETKLAPKAAAANPNARPNFKGDLDYARWLLANPERVDARDRAIIKEDLLATYAMQERLRQSGIDVDGLIGLVRKAAVA